MKVKQLSIACSLLLTFIYITLYISTGFELPRMNYNFNGKQHRFVYGSIVDNSALSKQVTFIVIVNHFSIFSKVLLALGNLKLAHYSIAGI